MDIFLEDDPKEEVIRKIANYMQNLGFKVRSINITGQTPYVIFNNLTSVNYKVRKTKSGNKGIVFYCSKDGKDMKLLSNKLGLTVYENNSDPDRPYALFIPNDMLCKAIDILKENSDNYIGGHYEQR